MNYISSTWSDGVSSVTYEKNSIYHDKSLSPLKYFLFVVVVLLICFMLYHTAIGDGKTLTFTNILDFLQNLPVSNINLNFTNGLIQESWGLFDFLRVTINLFVTIFNVLAFIFSGLVYVLQFIIGFFSYFLAV